jgi:hypothetical protein
VIAVEVVLMISGVLLALRLAGNWYLDGSVFGRGGWRQLRRRIRAWIRQHSSLHRMRHARRVRIKRAAFDDLFDEAKTEVDRMLADASFLMRQAAEWQANRERP